VRPVGFGVLGARSYVATRAVMPAIRRSGAARLVAVASRGGPVPDDLGAIDVGSYEAVIDHPEVEAVYLPLPNGLHREWAERAVAAGRHVLCEKPLAPSVADADAMYRVADAAGVLLAEAWMTPFQERWRRALDLAIGGELGEIRHVRAELTFMIDSREVANYRWDVRQGGGALLDVGIYCLGPAVELWGAEPASVAAGATRGVTGVDVTTSAWLDWGAGRTAAVLGSFELPERQLVEIVGTAGRLVIDDRPHTGGPGATEMRLVGSAGSSATLRAPGCDPYELMVTAFARAVRGVQTWPRRAPDVLAMLRLIERIGAVAG
jgi:xylose dehydrogenase (NAD/NADP)